MHNKLDCQTIIQILPFFILGHKKKRDLNLAFFNIFIISKNKIYSTVTDFAKLRG